MNHTCLCLLSRSWSSYTNPGGMKGWVCLGTAMVSKQSAKDSYMTEITVVSCSDRHASLGNWSAAERRTLDLSGHESHLQGPLPVGSTNCKILPAPLTTMWLSPDYFGILFSQAAEIFASNSHVQTSSKQWHSFYHAKTQRASKNRKDKKQHYTACRINKLWLQKPKQEAKVIWQRLYWMIPRDKRDRLTDRRAFTHIGNNHLHLMHSMQPN